MNVSGRQCVSRSVLVAGAAAVLVTGCASVPGAFRGGMSAAMNRTDFKDPSLFQGTQDRGDFGWKVFGQFDPGKTERIVFEGGFYQMGDATFDGLYQGVADQGTIETTSVEASVGYRYPITERFSAGGRLGAAAVDVKEREVFGGTPYQSSASEVVPFGGVVFRVGFGDTWGLSAHWDRYLDVGKVGQTGEGDIDSYGISADFRFGGTNSD